MYRHPYYPPPEPPRSPWKYIVIAAAIAGAFAGMFGGAAFFLLRVRSGVRATPVSVSPTSPTGAGTQPPPLPIPDDPSLVPVDESAPPPGTPASSLRARPPWGKLDRVRTSSETVTEYAPQLEKPLEVFMAAAPFGDAVDRALVVCRVQTFAKADTFAGDDLHVRVAVGATPLVANDGPEDANLAFVTAPLATLHKGEPVRFEVYDRDVFGLQPIAKPQLTWNGGPLTALDSAATIECRQLSGDPLVKLTSLHAAAADQSANRVRKTKLDGRAPDWGWPAIEIGVARRSVADVAGLVGWDDARVRKRIASTDAAIASLEAQKPQVFESVHATATDSTSVAGVSVTTSGMTCASHGAACSIKVTVKNLGDRPLSLSNYAGVSFYAANARSGPQPAQADVHALTAGQLDPGASFETTVDPARSHDLGNGPAILGVCKDGRCGAVKVR